MNQDGSKAKGGFARAEALTAEARKDIARRAALARWDADVPKAKCEGAFPLGETEISAAVLPNGKRLLTQAAFLRAIGRSRSPRVGTGILVAVDGVPNFLQAEVLKPFISEELLASTTPFFYLDLEGRRAVGYDAELLPKVAEVYLRFRDGCLASGKAVPNRYAHMVQACDIIMRGLARVGIIALVDEATGYQNERARDALAKILEQFVTKEIQNYVRLFPLGYYKGLCRLRRVPFSADLQLPRYFGHLTNNIVYARLAPAVLEELRRKNPTVNGRSKEKHYNWLTPGMGHPKLLQHLGSVVTLMDLAGDSWDQFMEMLNRIHPTYQDMPLFHDLPD